MKPTTAGERLFIYIRDTVLTEFGHGDLRWDNLNALFAGPTGTDEFVTYVRGAVAVHCMRRLLRYWEDAKPGVLNHALRMTTVRSFIKREVFYSVDDAMCTKLARMVIDAECSSHRDISITVESEVLKDRNVHSCYLCGSSVRRNAGKDDSDRLTLEHLWPTSLGGDSIEENLLPACLRCQRTTKDTASWEWFNIQNIVLPPSPSNKALISVCRRAGYARHYLEVVRYCDENTLTLKQGFLAIGQLQLPVTHVKTSAPVTFFDLRTV